MVRNLTFSGWSAPPAHTKEILDTAAHLVTRCSCPTSAPVTATGTTPDLIHRPGPRPDDQETAVINTEAYDPHQPTL
jgi:hypothetical protein